MTLDAGIHLNVPTRDYFADPAPSPSLTQSLAKIILERSPLHAWHAHPRLNPDYRHDDATKYDVGNIAHALMLGRGKELVVLEHDDWRTKAAKEAREEAALFGKLAVLGKHYALADKMVHAAHEQLMLRGEIDLFRNGDGEVVTIWQEGPIWLRQMIDWLSPDCLTVADYKTTDMSVAPHNLPRMMSNAGWHIQAAMAQRGLHKIARRAADRRYLFVVQETEKPYALNVVELSDDVLTMGAKMLDMAARKWCACVVADHWPGYPLETCVPEFPGWAEQQWLDREIHEAARERVPENVLDAG